METYAAGEDGDDLRVGCHLGCEEYHRYEHEQRTEHVHEVRYEIQVIVEDDGFQRCFVGHEIVYLLAYVEDDHDADYEQQRDEECEDEFLHYVKVQYSRFQIHSLILFNSFNISYLGLKALS